MAEKQAPQKQSFKKSVKHAASEIEPKDKGIQQKPGKQKMYAQPGFKKDLVDTREKPESEDEKSVLKDIMSISGQSGLFKFISQARNGIIVESLETKKRMQAFSSMKVNSLKDIAVFTKKEEILLEVVFKKISDKESGGAAIDAKSTPDELKAYFLLVLPDFDQERVYGSDIKKMINWYNILQKNDLLKFEKDQEKAKGKTEEKSKGKTEEKSKGKTEEKSKGKTDVTGARKAKAPSSGKTPAGKKAKPKPKS